MFSVSAKTQYAIRAMSYLAKHQDDVCTSSEIAASEHIPSKYLEGIMTHLKDCGLVSVERGNHGGYRLQLNPNQISMLSIVEAMDGSVMPVDCVKLPGACAKGSSCLPRQFWIGLKVAIDLYLGSRTLRDISEGADHE